MNYKNMTRMPEGSAMIYAITSGSGNMYIGSTIEPKRRLQNHKKLLRDGKHTSFLLQRAYDKHGEDSIQYKTLIVCSTKDRFFYEAQMIEKLGSYNLIKDAGQPPAGSFLGLKHTAKGIENLKAAALRRWEKHREEVTNPLCEKAWKLVESGMYRSIACKEVGVSHTIFWNWIAKNNLKKLIKK